MTQWLPSTAADFQLEKRCNSVHIFLGLENSLKRKKKQRKKKTLVFYLVELRTGGKKEKKETSQREKRKEFHLEPKSSHGTPHLLGLAFAPFVRHGFVVSSRSHLNLSAVLVSI